eukprot:1262859-Amorphochlora_amoeboformis.AAC.2
MRKDSGKLLRYLEEKYLKVAGENLDPSNLSEWVLGTLFGLLPILSQPCERNGPHCQTFWKLVCCDDAAFTGFAKFHRRKG